MYRDVNGPARLGSPSPSLSLRITGTRIPAGIFDGGQILPPIPVFRPHQLISNGFGNNRADGSGNSRADGFGSSRGDGFGSSKGDGFDSKADVFSSSSRADGSGNNKVDGFSSSRKDGFDNKLQQ
ncbi:hypothetical protein SLEP1_g4561 [Rubroshorea leprosula]|uniref:Uncharacterized protein n=1 Tax=Rubroshorea leprosula TaxID=152421 RepID=A0AAV5HZV5_9ROSI|nr:hypothetical protein SLEP1_g4561 [Rubroshorea leprosula]